MSLTPLDETDGHPGDDEKPAAERESDGHVAGRFLDRVRSVLGRLVTVVRRPHQSSETAVEQAPHRLPGDDARDAETPRPMERSRRVVGTDGVPQRTSSSTSSSSTVFDAVEPDDGPSSDRPELVATWDDGGLTLAEPGDSDASISSDTWTEMER